MLMALALLAAIDAVPSPTVSLTLTRGEDRTPVSATPRSLSDVARELREGRKAVGGFSAAESTIPRSVSYFIPAFEPEPVTTAPEPEAVIDAPPMDAATYFVGPFGRHRKSGRLHQRPAGPFAAPTLMSPHPGRRSRPPMFQPYTMAGRHRQR